MKQKARFKIAAMIFCLSLVVLTFVPRAQADAWNKKTTVTFSAPAEIPGVGAQTLPAAQSLPHTASPLPLVGLIGLLSLGAGFALAVMPKRII